MTLPGIWHTVLTSIQAMGYIPFIVLLIVDMLLWRVHPVLGLIATLLTFAYLVHWI